MWGKIEDFDCSPNVLLLFIAVVLDAAWTEAETDDCCSEDGTAIALDAEPWEFWLVLDPALFLLSDVTEEDFFGVDEDCVACRWEDVGVCSFWLFDEPDLAEEFFLAAAVTLVDPVEVEASPISNRIS